MIRNNIAIVWAKNQKKKRKIHRLLSSLKRLIWINEIKYNVRFILNPFTGYGWDASRFFQDFVHWRVERWNRDGEYLQIKNKNILEKQTTGTFFSAWFCAFSFFFLTLSIIHAVYLVRLVFYKYIYLSFSLFTKVNALRKFSFITENSTRKNVSCIVAVGVKVFFFFKYCIYWFLFS